MGIKQVIVIRKLYPDPNNPEKFRKVRTGKIIAQACHASMKVFFDRMHEVYWTEEEDGDGMSEGYEWVADLTPEMEEWKNGSFTKACVQVDHEEELLEIVKRAEEAGLPVALITDAGVTEFNGVPTNTCCAIGPADSDKIDLITGNLRLY
jgi:PTH2 family peptidyl-tRNA hydrolase